MYHFSLFHSFVHRHLTCFHFIFLTIVTIVHACKITFQDLAFNSISRNMIWLISRNMILYHIILLSVWTIFILFSTVQVTISSASHNNSNFLNISTNTYVLIHMCLESNTLSSYVSWHLIMGPKGLLWLQNYLKFKLKESLFIIILGGWVNPMVLRVYSSLCAWGSLQAVLRIPYGVLGSNWGQLYARQMALYYLFAISQWVSLILEISGK